MDRILDLQVMLPDITSTAGNSNWSLCCSGCNSAASTGGCGGGKTNMAEGAILVDPNQMF